MKRLLEVKAFQGVSRVCNCILLRGRGNMKLEAPVKRVQASVLCVPSSTRY